MTVTYDPTNNAMTVVGGTLSSPYGLDLLWSADKAGTLNNVNPRNITGADASPVAVDKPLRPTDYYVLGLADVFITVTNYTAPCTVQIAGTEEYGVAQTEDVAITGNGTYNSTKYWRTIATTQVTVFGGNFTYKLTQGQWGVIWSLVPDQYRIDCAIVIGDGSTATYFSIGRWISGSWPLFQIMWNTSVGATTLLDVKANATVTFGWLIDASKKSATRGPEFIFYNPGGQQVAWLFESGSVSYFYNCIFSSSNFGAGYCLLVKGYITRIWNCTFCHVQLQNLYNVDINNVNFTDVSYGAFWDVISGCVMNDIYAFDGGTQSFFYSALNNISATVSNSKLYGFKYVYYAANVGNGTLYLINVTSDNWAFNWVVSSQKVMRQYTFDLTVTDKDNNPLNNAAITLKDKNGTVVSSVSTNESGQITTQTVTRGYYAQPTGNVLQDYGPHTLTITKAGYQTYQKTLILGDKVTWEIKLAKAQAILLNSGSPIVNLSPTDSENKMVLAL